MMCYKPGHLICAAAVGHFGMTHQLAKTVEELGELSQVVSRCLEASIAGEPDDQYIDHLSEEIADVEIMLVQLKSIYRNNDLVEEWRTAKLERLFNRISGDGEDD